LDTQVYVEKAVSRFFFSEHRKRDFSSVKWDHFFRARFTRKEFFMLYKAYTSFLFEINFYGTETYFLLIRGFSFF